MPHFRNVRTRVLLISVLLAFIAAVTGDSLLIVRDRVRQQAAPDLSMDLARSLITFQNLQRQRRDALIHENALLADLPSLKALMMQHFLPGRALWRVRCPRNTSRSYSSKFRQSRPAANRLQRSRSAASSFLRRKPTLPGKQGVNLGSFCSSPSSRRIEQSADRSCWQLRAFSQCRPFFSQRFLAV